MWYLYVTTRIRKQQKFSYMKFAKRLILGMAILFCACNAQRQVLYLQDVADGSEIVLPDNYIIRIKPLDKLTVVVNSKNPELALPFNSSTNYSALSGTTTISSNITTNSLQTFTVDQTGKISLPIIGDVMCADLTREELEDVIEKKIIEAGYISDPQVKVNFLDMTISVIGEVNKPGRFTINRDQFTILEAIAMAGDLTIFGIREDVAVVRQKDGKNVVTKLDLRSQDIFKSPCYYLEQNDVVIVSPNKYKAATSEINQNRSFWISIATTAISVATLVITVIK